jgi:hypothetical protein
MSDQVPVEDFDNRKNTELFNLDDVQAYENEVLLAAREGRDPELRDPRLRQHDGNGGYVYPEDESAVVPPLTEQASLTPGVSNVEGGVVSPGVNQHHPATTEADLNNDPQETVDDAEVAEIIADEESTDEEPEEPTNEEPTE